MKGNNKENKTPLIRANKDVRTHLQHYFGRNRRHDYEIRTAIDSIQQFLFSPDTENQVIHLLLEHLLLITNSNIGSIFLFDNSNIQKPFTEFSSHPFIATETLKQWHKKNIIPNTAVFFNEPIPKYHRPLFIYPDHIKATALFPLVSHKEFIGICIIGQKNTQNKSYSASLLQRIIPLLTAAVFVLKSTAHIKNYLVKPHNNIDNEEYLAALVNNSPLGVIILSAENMIIANNIPARKIFFNDRNIDLNQRSIYELIPNYNQLFQYSGQTNSNPNKEHHSHSFHRNITQKNHGRTLVLNISLAQYTYHNTRLTTLQIQDVTAMHIGIENYQQDITSFKALTHLLPVAVIRVDTDWNCLYANDKWYEFSGMTPKDNDNTDNWIDIIHPDDIEKTLNSLETSLQTEQPLKQTIRLVSLDGDIRWCDFHMQLLFNRSGSISGLLGSFNDITEQLNYQKKLAHVAEYDILTGLANRHLLQQRIQQAFDHSQRTNHNIYLLFMDLDGFKHINDSMGHDAGDHLLKQVAQRLNSSLRKIDTIARFGGDEFVILLGSEKNHSSAIDVAEKILQTIAEPFCLYEKDIIITTSIGIAYGTDANSSPEKLLKQADSALYMAKHEGRNSIKWFTPELQKKNQLSINIASQLHAALEKQQYQLLYQPIADFNNDNIIGCEAQLQFILANDTVKPAKEFSNILEETGLIIDIERWTIETACKQLNQWQQSFVFSHDHFICCSISPKQLMSTAIIEHIKQCCEQYKINPNQLMLEVTENSIIHKPEKVTTVLIGLKQLGVKLALDDFGVGYASLTYLQKYPFDRISISSSFIYDLESNSNNLSIIQAIISLAHSLDLSVSVKNIHNKTLKDCLKHFKIDYYQGQSICFARSASEISDLLKNGL